MIEVSASVCERGVNRSDDVAMVQRCLGSLKGQRSRPYYEGQLDGRFGSKTSEAIIRFQMENGLTREKPGEIRSSGETIRRIEQKVNAGSGPKSEDIYTGFEPAVTLNEARGKLANGLFEIRPRNLPTYAVPVIDEDVGAIVGFRAEASGITRTYDVEGNVVHVEELGLETPLIDPIDLVSFGGVLALTVKKIIQFIAKESTKTAARAGANLISQQTLGKLKDVFRKETSRRLKFTKTTERHMKNRNRYVPVHILQIAVRRGSRSPDPQRMNGVYLYKIPLNKNGKSYNLEIVLREHDNTILHFLYK